MKSIWLIVLTFLGSCCAQARPVLPDVLVEAALRYDIGYYRAECGSRISTQREVPVTYYIAIGEKLADPSPNILLRMRGLRVRPYSDYLTMDKTVSLSPRRHVVLHLRDWVFHSETSCLVYVGYWRFDRPQRYTGPMYQRRSGRWNFDADDLRKVI